MDKLSEIDLRIQQKLAEQIGQLVINMTKLEAEVEYWRSKNANELNSQKSTKK